MEKIRAFPLPGNGTYDVCVMDCICCDRRGDRSGQAAGGTVSGAVPSGATVTSQNAAQPTVAAQGAVLYDATHNQFLFSKNADTQYYPASITKLMTALLVAENCNLSDTVTFSQTAVSNLESGAVTLQVKAGDTLRLRTVSMVCF